MGIFRFSNRLLKREKGFGILNIIGLSIGMSMSLLIIWYIHYHVTADAHHSNAGQIFRLVSKDKNNGSLSFDNPLPMAYAIQKDYPDEAKVAGLFGNRDYSIEVENKKFQVSGSISTSTIFEVLGFKLLAGGAKDVLSEPNSAVITQACALKVFGNLNPVGELLTVETFSGNIPITIKGVMEDAPLNSNYSPEVLFNWQSMNPPDWKEKWWWGGNQLFIKVGNKTQIANLEQNINTILERYNAKFIKGRYEFQLIPLKEAHFRTDIESPFSPGISSHLLWILGLVALVIMGVASINFINLAIGQAGKNAKDTGISKVLGASRLRIGLDFMAATFFKVFMSLLLATLITKLLSGTFQQLANIKEGSPFNNPVIWFVLIVMFVCIGVFTGGYPAIVLSRPKPAKLLSAKRGKGSSGKALQKPLIVTQFIIVNVLIIAVLFIFKQISFMKEHDLGFNKEGLIGVDISPLNSNLGQLVKSAKVLEQEIGKYSAQCGIVSMASTEAIPGTGFRNAFTIFDPANLEAYTVTSVGIDENYTSAFEIPVLEGKAFSGNSKATSGSILINETLKRKLGWDSIENKQLAIFNKNNQVPVIGVLKDIHINSLNQAIPPMIYRYKKNAYPQYMVFRIQNGHEKEALLQIKEQWEKLSGGKPFEPFSVEEKFKAMYGNEEKLSKIIGAFCLVAVLLSCFGLLAYTTLLTQQRTKEIGIRKVNGAKTGEILAMLNKDFVKWVAIAFMVACPIAYYAMNKWLENFAYKTTLSWWVFALAGLLAFGIAMLTISFQSYKAATRNPIESLRYE